MGRARPVLGPAHRVHTHAMRACAPPSSRSTGSIGRKEENFFFTSLSSGDGLGWHPSHHHRGHGVRPGRPNPHSSATQNNHNSNDSPCSPSRRITSPPPPLLFFFFLSRFSSSSLVRSIVCLHVCVVCDVGG
ncbi:hypothetical protein Scep_004289 [Stephania cephalantha]|uniref:Uncharacterized protein n=1 Tax=Stephania cephalantha TaxID=152367 RepID=A0AAP0KT41_9MAGN